MLVVLNMAVFFLLVSHVEAQTLTKTTYGPIWSSLFSAQSSSCGSFRSACIPTDPGCGSALCRICTSLGITPSIEPCCGAAHSAASSACFSDIVAGNPITYTTPTGPLSPRTTSFVGSATACASVSSLQLSCEAQTPTFRDLEFSSMSSCICSVNGTNAPTYYDNFFSTCLAWASVSATVMYQTIGKLNGTEVNRTPCQHFATAASAFPTTTFFQAPTSIVTPPRTTSDAMGAEWTRILHLRVIMGSAISMFIVGFVV
ncbi:hypothetical protein B0H63DRAFT_190633 [Podospora didyma]|uniref:Extracellular membrane protein CFEM domain-containing protein n=1 Tax=Podospora didyma TaxID=330526 RepID=A0AAE0NQX3_9PEZI|nr:hypothetical protein B0H63DRAFT_190633 [Podospora didyma]